MKKILVFLACLFCFIPFVNAEETYGARIGSTNYESIKAAIAAAKTGDEVVLLEDVNRIDISSDKDITLNLNGRTITRTISNDGGKVKIIGNGIIKFDLYADGLYNSKDGVMIVDGIIFDSGTSVTNAITNSGTMTIKNAKFMEYVQSGISNKATGILTIDGGEIINGTNNGQLTINGGTIINGILNKEIMVVNGGVFKDKITNTRGTVTINGGTFNGESVASNYDPDSEFNYDDVPSTIIVNNGNFNVTRTAFSNENFSSHSTITINDGNITSQGSLVYSSGADTNKVNINGGKFTYKGGEDGNAFYASAGTFVIGKNDGAVSTTSPIMTINSGKINSFGNDIIFEFYDGKFILNKKLDDLITGFNEEKYPTGYYVKHDSNSDSTYTAYLAKIEEPKEDDTVTEEPSDEEDKVIEEPKDESKEEVKDEVKEEVKEDVEETVENPPTGLYISLGFVGLLMVSLLTFGIFKKKSYFSKI